MRRKFLLVLFSLGLIMVCLNSATGKRADIPQSWSSEPVIQDDLIRLHVIANSDSPEDQAVKLQVRDAVLRYLKPILADITASEQAVAEIGRRQGEISEIANQVLRSQGMSYQSQLEIGRFDFPLKTYGPIVVPAGEYEAVRLLLGQASGRNWWCVLFPPLCFIDINTAVAVPPPSADEHSSTISQDKTKVELRWKVVEWWKETSSVYH